MNKIMFRALASCVGKKVAQNAKAFSRRLLVLMLEDGIDSLAICPFLVINYVHNCSVCMQFWEDFVNHP